MSYKIAIFWQSVRPDRKNRILKMVLKNYVVFWKTVPPLDIKNSTENKWVFLDFYCDSKNSCIITEKSLLTSSNGDWKCFLKSRRNFGFWRRRISKNGPSVYRRKYRVLTNSGSVPFGDVVYGSPLIQA